MTLRVVDGDEPPEGGIFGGLRVVDASTGIAGPYATMFLADHGADVIKVEPPGGDPYRAAAGFQTLNRGKRSAVINLTTERGRARFALLARTADVVVVDETQEHAAALGIDYATLTAPVATNDAAQEGHPHRPELVYLAVPPYGERGPFTDRAASPGLLAAASGIMAGQMSYSGDPVYLTLPLAAYGTAALGAAAVAGALYARERWGRGQFLEVSELAGALALQIGGVRSDRFPQPGGRQPNPTGARGRLPAYRLYQAGDGGWFFLACGSAQFFHRMLVALGHAELAADPRLENAPWGLGTPEAIELLVPILEQTFRTQPRDHWIEFFREADVPAQPVLTRDEYFASHVVAANEMRTAVDHPALGRVEMMGVPLVMEAAPGRVDAPAPGVGEHTDEVLGEAAAAAAPIARLRPDEAAHHMLDGVRVIDLCSFIAGPVCPRHLAMLGADVTKVESPTGDAFRQMGLGFMGWNQGKRDIALDLRRDDAREVIYRLVREADVVVENYRPGVAERLGVGYETLRAINPRLVYLSSPGWGDDITMRDAPGFDPLVQAFSGAMAAQGGNDEPVFYSVALNDVLTPVIATFGVLAALFHRERTGDGQRVRTALARTGLAVQAAEFTVVSGIPRGDDEEQPAMTGTDGPELIPTGGPFRDVRSFEAEEIATPAAAIATATSASARGGRRRGGARGTATRTGFVLGGRDFPGPTAGQRWYRCSDDRDVYVEAASPAQRRALAATAGAAVATAALVAPFGTQRCRAATDALASAFQTRPRDEWVAALDAAGVPCCPVVTREELLDAEHVRANELVIEQHDAVWGETTNLGMLIRATGTPGRIERSAPALSEHADDILRELGYSPGEQAALVASGAVLRPQTGA